MNLRIYTEPEPDLLTTLVQTDDGFCRSSHSTYLLRRAVRVRVSRPRRYLRDDYKYAHTTNEIEFSRL